MKLLARLSAGDRSSPGSRYSDALRNGLAKMRFGAELEREFREFYEAQNLPRARFALMAALAAVLLISAVEQLFGPVDVDPRVGLLRVGLLTPLLALAVLASYLPAARRYHARLAAAGIFVIGTVVIVMSQFGALSGDSYMLMAPLMVILYACLFLGLLFQLAVLVSVLLVGLFFALGLWLGLGGYQLLYTTAMLAVAGLVAGYSAFSFERLLRRNFVEARLLNELAERDGLTSLYNRRIFDELMGRIWRQARREDATIEIIFIDIDYFKVYNDLYGHQAGDDCLKLVARTIARAAKRPFDFAARYGGEEFVLVLYGPPFDYARTLPERIRLDVADLAIPHEGSGIGNYVTVSVGVSHARPVEGRSLAGAIQAADEALYEAKQGGRNQVVFRNTDECEVETGKFRVAYRQIIS